MLDQEIEKFIKDEVAKRVDAVRDAALEQIKEVKEHLGKDTHADKFIDKGANWLAKRYSIFGGLAKLFAALPAWVEIILVLAFLSLFAFGAVKIVGFFAPADKSAATAAQIQGLKATAEQAQTVANAKQKEATDLQEKFNQAEAQKQILADQLAAQYTRTSSARTQYQQARSNPIAVITSEGKSEEQFLRDVGDAARQALNGAKR